MKNPEKETTSTNLFRESESDKPITNYKEIKKCPRCDGYFLYNFHTAEIKPVFCKAYKCETCGAFKKYNLLKAINKYVECWDRVRLWTFTITSNVFNGMEVLEKLKLTSKIWKDFRDLIRKSKTLTTKEKKFQYIKVVELQENGSPHYHALVDTFVYWKTIGNYWRQAIQMNTKYRGWLGTVDMRGSIPKKQAGKYVVKYITKQIETIDLKLNFRRWSKSGNVSLFPKVVTMGDWVFISLHLSSYSITSVIEMLILNRNEQNFAPNQLFPIEKPPNTKKNDQQPYNFVYGYD